MYKYKLIIESVVLEQARQALKTTFLGTELTCKRTYHVFAFLCN